MLNLHLKIFFHFKAEKEQTNKILHLRKLAYW